MADERETIAATTDSPVNRERGDGPTPSETANPGAPGEVDLEIGRRAPSGQAEPVEETTTYEETRPGRNDHEALTPAMQNAATGVWAGASLAGGSGHGSLIDESESAMSAMDEDDTITGELEANSIDTDRAAR